MLRLPILVMLGLLAATCARPGEPADSPADAGSQYRLGLAHIRALGDDRHLDKGVKWIIASARAGHVPARTYLARLYTHGLIVPYQPETAFRLLLEAAGEDDPAARYGLAQCYDLGIGVDRDPDQAWVWFERAVRAADRDDLDAEAARAIGLCHRDGKGTERSYPVAARWLIRAAQGGSPGALFELGNFYAFGLGVGEDPRKAFALYLRAAHAGSAQACLAVSRGYRDGKGVTASDEEAARWLEIARRQFEDEARLGSVDAATDLYLYLSRGVFERDEQAALDWLRQAVDRGYPPALTLFGEALATGRGLPEDVPRAVEVLQRAAAAHDAGAHYLLFQLILRGEGIPQDPYRALEHLEAAAEAGNVSAMKRLAEWYRARPTLPDANALAEDWYRRARAVNEILAERENIQAQLALVTFYGQGRGTPKDTRKAFYWLHRAAENGWDEAQFMLGSAYEKGLGVDRDPALAFQWFTRAAEQDYVAAMLNVAAIYDRGELGVERDPEAADTWYQRAFEATEDAADEGDPEAANLMVSFYHQGWGRPRNLNQQMHWLHRAAELGHVEAQLNLSKAYSEGKGVPFSPDDSIRWLRAAAENGNPEAQYLLGRLYDEGTSLERDFVEAYTYYYLAADAGYRPAQVLLEEMEVTLDPARIAEGRKKARAILTEYELATGDLDLLP